MNASRTTATAVLLWLAVPAFAAEPALWPQWRGPTRDGHVRAEPWPDTLAGDALTQHWRSDDLGPSYSGPIVASDRVFTTATVNKTDEVVMALDRSTGKIIWTTKWPGSITVPFFAAKNGSWIRSTPAYDGETLYVAGIRDVLVALDGTTGKERWRLDFVKEFGTPPPDFGFVCSPLVDADGVYVQAGGSFCKVDKASGKVKWRTLEDGGGMYGSAFSSPIFATLAGKDQVIVQTRTKLAGVDRQSGSVIWSQEIPSFRGMNILTPLPHGKNSVFTSTYGGTTQMLNISGTTAAKGWSLKYEGYMTTPVVVDDHAYWLGKDKRFICVDLKTGTEKWRSDRTFSDYCSLVVNRDKILALDSRGVLLLIRANPDDFELLDQRKVSTSESWAHLAICGEDVVIRDLTGLSVFRWKN